MYGCAACTDPFFSKKRGGGADNEKVGTLEASQLVHCRELGNSFSTSECSHYVRSRRVRAVESENAELIVELPPLIIDGQELDDSYTFPPGLELQQVRALNNPLVQYKPSPEKKEVGNDGHGFTHSYRTA